MQTYRLKNLDCASCAAKIEKALNGMPEVKFVSVNFATATMQIDAPDIEVVIKTINDIEPGIVVEEGNPLHREPKFWTAHRGELTTIGITILLLAFGTLYKSDLYETSFRWAEYLVLLTAYVISGWEVLRSAFTSLFKGKVFNEHFLMTAATLGAIGIDAMPEAVAVMLFYVVGELFQSLAVNRSRNSVHALLELRPDYANLLIAANECKKVSPFKVHPGQSILAKPGEKIPLDGIVSDGRSFVDTAALTGESIPRAVKTGEPVLAGMINGNGLLTIKVTKKFSESSVVKMAKLVEAAAGKKAQTERFITTFARYYTPVVVVCAFALAVLPPIFIPDARFDDWLYRALVVLVVSCPCALVVSIPLGYFGGIGGASRSGILIKGSNYLDALTRVRTVVFDKTGTLTKGDFKVTQIVPGKDFSEQELLRYCAYAEAHSNHPIAQSVIDTYGKPIEYGYVAAVTEISGHGLRTIVDGAEIIVGNDKMLHRENIEHDVCEVNGTVLHVVVNKKYAGYIVISDSLKEDALQAVQALHALNIRTVMLTGDNKSSADFFAKKLGIEEYAYELLPEDKVAKLEHYMNSSGNGKVAFIGDGINDAAVIARADIGIAMGALGSAAAIETADIVLMADSPMQVLKAIAVAKKTRVIVWQNIGFALGIKLLFILLGTFGLASMWEAVFADMGVALLAILNAVRVYN